jgi:glycosyltransferase involved in cell wall biosynthesis
LSASSRAYGTSPASKSERAGTAGVTYAFALDAQRHLAIGGRYLSWLAIPDRWSNWALAAIPAGLSLIYRKRVDVILVTFPIATAVFIGLALHWLSGKPLVVDFRDSMTEDEYPRDPRVRKVCRWIERAVIRCGSRFIFTTKSARRMYLDRYPQLAPDNCVVIANGYDEDDFAGVTDHSRQPVLDRPVRLVHAGLIYPDDRDPRAFFRAVHRLKFQGTISARSLVIDLRASGSEAYYSGILRELGIDDIVRLLPPLPHLEALRDTAEADGLLLFQAASCNHQIPAKVYEYLRFSRPILALTSPAGDTADLLREVGGATMIDLGDEDEIFTALPRFVAAVREGVHPLPQQRLVQRYTRKNGAAELANCLDSILCGDGARVTVES